VPSCGKQDANDQFPDDGILENMAVNAKLVLVVIVGLTVKEKNLTRLQRTENQPEETVLVTKDDLAGPSW